MSSARPRAAGVRATRVAAAPLLAASVSLAAALGVSTVLAPASASAAALSAAPIGGPQLASPGLVVGPGVPRPPDVADTFVVADMDDGSVLAAKGAHTRMRPASTLKALTALALLPVLDKKTVYVARVADVRVDGTRVGMIEDTPYTVDDLFNAMLLVSANDATSGLAAAAGGNARTVALMTRVAQHLQARDTTVKDPSGLDTPGQYSSAYDLALVGRAAMARDDFRGYATKTSTVFPGRPSKVPGQPRPVIPIDNKNGLLLHGYPGMVGGKTGYTSKAGNTFLGVATRDGRTVLVTLMHTHGEAEKAERKLFDWAFANVAGAQPVGVLVDPAAATPSASASPSPSTPLVATTGPTSGGSPMVLFAGGAVAVALAGWLLWSVAASARRRRLRSNPLGLPPLRGR